MDKASSKQQILEIKIEPMDIEESVKAPLCSTLQNPSDRCTNAAKNSTIKQEPVDTNDKTSSTQVGEVLTDDPACVKLEMDPSQDLEELPIEFEFTKGKSEGKDKLDTKVDSSSPNSKKDESLDDMKFSDKSGRKKKIVKKKISGEKVGNGSAERKEFDYKHIYHCDICNKTFDRNSELIFHSRSHSTTSMKGRISEADLIKSIKKCTICNRLFKSSNELTAHMRKHAGEKPYECNVCSKRFNQTCHLKAHARLHTGEKPFECPICGKKFNQNSHLKPHIKIHSEEKHPYQCSVCDKLLSDASCLKRHEKVHKKAKPFKCNVCNRSYKFEDYLKKHMKIHSDQENV